jgi:PIN domain nuclease of toxin-antitoxin system
VTHLLDTHVFLWLLGSPSRVPTPVLDRLADRANELLVSAVSAMEVATKVRLGKLPSARHVVETWPDRVAEIGARDLPLTTQQALFAGSMSWAHRDPFDRMLVAQAIVLNVTLVTDHAALHGVPTLRALGW